MFASIDVYYFCVILCVLNGMCEWVMNAVEQNDFEGEIEQSCVSRGSIDNMSTSVPAPSLVCVKWKPRDSRRINLMNELYWMWRMRFQLTHSPDICCLCLLRCWYIQKTRLTALYACSCLLTDTDTTTTKLHEPTQLLPKMIWGFFCTIGLNPNATFTFILSGLADVCLQANWVLMRRDRGWERIQVQRE